jgi:hypothetical protein
LQNKHKTMQNNLCYQEFLFFCKTTKKIQNQKKLYIDITLKTKMEKKDIAKQKKKKQNQLNK